MVDTLTRESRSGAQGCSKTLAIPSVSQRRSIEPTDLADCSRQSRLGALRGTGLSHLADDSHRRLGHSVNRPNQEPKQGDKGWHSLVDCRTSD